MIVNTEYSARSMFGRLEYSISVYYDEAHLLRAVIAPFCKSGVASEQRPDNSTRFV